MKIRGALFKPVVLTLFAAIAGGAVWSGDAPAQTPGTWTTALVPIAGTVRGQPESVSFTGQAKINSKLAPDPDFNRPSLVLTIDLTGLSGVGSSSRAKYVIAGPENVQRKVAATHVVEFTFPFAKSGAMNLGSAQSGVASFALGFDPNTGAVTSASGNVTSANPPR
jgi:hypothetical protein